MEPAAAKDRKTTHAPTRTLGTPAQAYIKVPKGTTPTGTMRDEHGLNRAPPGTHPETDRPCAQGAPRKLRRDILQATKHQTTARDGVRPSPTSPHEQARTGPAGATLRGEVHESGAESIPGIARTIPPSTSSEQCETELAWDTRAKGHGTGKTAGNASDKTKRDAKGPKISKNRPAKFRQPQTAAVGRAAREGHDPRSTPRPATAHAPMRARGRRGLGAHQGKGARGEGGGGRAGDSPPL